MKRRLSGALAAIAIAIAGDAAQAGTTWSDRSGDLQNTGNAGDEPGLTYDNVKDLKVVDSVSTPGGVVATPVVTDGLVVVGDMTGIVYVVDAAKAPAKVLIALNTGAPPSTTTVGKLPRTGTPADAQGDKFGVGHLPQELGNYKGVQSTATLGTVTLAGGVKELRAYIGANTNKATMWCLNLSAVERDRAGLNAAAAPSDGAGYLCAGNGPDGVTTAWPRSLSPAGFGRGNGTYNGAPMFSAGQTIKVNGVDQVRDVLYTPTTGLDCADGRMWALDALTGELLWEFDPVPNGNGGTIWTTPAMSRDKRLVYVSTGDCVGNPQMLSMREAVVALNADDGTVAWWHQKRLVDTADLDVGTGIAVADVDGRHGCHVVISSDKDGCIYAYNQTVDIPTDVSSPGYDPLRAGQQRVLWRECFVGGSLNGGFNASNGALSGRLFVQQTSGYPDSHVGADDSNAFAVDVCNGQVQWASSDVSNGRTDAAIASGMLFQTGVTRKAAGVNGPGYQWVQEVTVVDMDVGLARVPTVLATLKLPAQGSLGGGGVAIADGTVYVPTVKGLAIARVVPGSNASAPVRRGLNVFAGPYPEPLAPGGLGSYPAANPEDPYPLMFRKPGAPEFFRSLTDGGPQGVLPDGTLPQ